jgi:hypothetical protein
MWGILESVGFSGRAELAAGGNLDETRFTTVIGKISRPQSIQPNEI